MLNPFEAIEQLMEAGVRKVDLHNDQPHNTPIVLADTVEAKAAELISHYQRRVHDLLESNNEYLERARKSEEALGYALDREKIMADIAKARERRLAELLEPTPPGKRLTVRGLADAFDAFWNAAMEEGHNRGGAAMDCAAVTVSGFAAVSAKLREMDPPGKNTLETRSVDKSNNGEIGSP